MLEIQQIKSDLVNLNKKYWWLMPLTIFLVWRVLLEIIGQYSYRINLSELSFKSFSQNIWWRWDSSWYASIANQGYSLPVGQQPNVTFFPLYPLIWKFFRFISGFSNYISGLFVSNILALGSFIILYRWLLIVWNEKIAKKSLLALAVFPTSFFLISVYSESTLLILLASAFLLSEYGKWKWVALTALLASAARPVGILLWPTFMWLWFSKTKDSEDKKKSDFLLLLILPPIGILLFSFFLWYQVGDPIAWLHGQGSYGRNLASPFKLLYAYSKNIATQQEFWLRHLFEMVFLFFIIICLPKLKKINPAYLFFTILNLLPSFFSNTFTSIQRFALLIVPIFVVVAMQKRWVYFMYICISTVLLVFCIYQFVNFNWAG